MRNLKPLRPRAAAFITVLGIASGSIGLSAEYYVSPAGSETNAGTADSPWDLKSALNKQSHDGKVQPGDTIWMCGGVYRPTVIPAEAACWESTIAGTPEAPITVRGMSGERAILDGDRTTAPLRNIPIIWVKGADVQFRDFEVTCSDKDRVLSDAGSHPDSARSMGISIMAARTKVINVVVHDTAEGIYLDEASTDSEIYGNIIFYTGWDAPDRGHGPAIYAKNRNGHQYYIANITFWTFNDGIRMYGNASGLDYFVIEKNISFENGIVAKPQGDNSTKNYFLGGERMQAQSPRYVGNISYFPTDANMVFNTIGYHGGAAKVVFEDNYWVGGKLRLTGELTFASFARNTLWMPVSEGRLPDNGVDNIILTARPTGTKVFVEPNKYEAGRANVTVFNWDKADAVSVDISKAGLAEGDAFIVRDVEDLFGEPVVKGVYAGAPVSLPMKLTKVTQPVGVVPVPPVHTSAEFGVFLVTRAPAGAK